MPLYLAVVLPAMRLVTQPALACSMRGAFDEPFAGFDGCFRRDGHVDMVGPVDDDLAVFCRDGARLVIDFVFCHAATALEAPRLFQTPSCGGPSLPLVAVTIWRRRSADPVRKASAAGRRRGWPCRPCSKSHAEPPGPSQQIHASKALHQSPTLICEGTLASNRFA